MIYSWGQLPQQRNKRTRQKGGVWTERDWPAESSVVIAVAAWLAELKVVSCEEEEEKQIRNIVNRGVSLSMVSQQTYGNSKSHWFQEYVQFELWVLRWGWVFHFWHKLYQSGSKGWCHTSYNLNLYDSLTSALCLQVVERQHWHKPRLNDSG